MRWKLGMLCAGALLAGCDREQDSPVAAVAGHAHAAPRVADAALVAQALNDLRAATASWHNEKLVPEGYDTPVGCIDERIMGVSPASARGMGYHLADLSLVDDHIDLLQPEILVYGKNPANGKLRLAGFDYFIPASAQYPSPHDGGTPPQIMGMDYTWSEPHGGWMFHIWSWWHNPDGMFDNFNPAVPTCDCELNPGDFSCAP